jgi:predicted nuclease with TOPRIM domain
LQTDYIKKIEISWEDLKDYIIRLKRENDRLDNENIDLSNKVERLEKKIAKMEGEK